MSGVNSIITREGMKLLGATKGTTIVALEAAIVARDNIAWGTVRIHLDDADLDVMVNLQDLPLNQDGDVEEFGVLAVSEARPGAPVVEGVDTEAQWRDVGLAVKEVTLVNDRVVTLEAGRKTLTRSFTQAIVFSLSDGSNLVLDKGAWFSEMITIGMGASWEDLVYDSSQDWEDDPEEPEVQHV